MNIYQPVISGSLTVTGSTTFFGNITINSGSLTMTSGSLTGTASLASNALLLQGTGSVGFATTASLLQVSSSQQQISSSQQQISASLLNVVANYATTGSNSFRANQSITGSLVVSSTITAQTLVVQTVTSSIVYSSGSNLFGSALGDRQTFTGSLQVTGSGPHTIFGNVVIGNTTSVNASAKLEVKGEAFITPIGTTASKLHLYNNDSTNETYIYDSGSSTNSILILSPGGINKALVVSSSGFVGIGTTTPTSLLEVQKDQNAQTGIRVKNSTAGTIAGVEFGAYTNSGNGGFGKYSTGNTPYKNIPAGSTYIYNGASGDISLLNDAASGNISFAAGASSTAQMFISTAGSVGIGTTSPVQKLDVVGRGHFGGVDTPYLDFKSTDTTGVGWQFKQISFKDATNAELYAIGYNYPNLKIEVAGTRVVTLASTGNMGVGNSLPQCRLDLGTSYGASGEKFLIYNDDNSSALAGTKMGFYIDRFSESNSVAFVFPQAGGTTSRYHIAYKSTSGTTIADVCYVNYNSTSWTFPSDERMKNVEGIIPNALDKIKDLRAVYYTQKRDPEQKRKVGLLAQDLLEVLPEVVDVPDTELDSDGNQRYMSVALADTIPLLVKAIQELKAELDTAKAEITELKNK